MNGRLSIMMVTFGNNVVVDEEWLFLITVCNPYD